LPTTGAFRINPSHARRPCSETSQFAPYNP
jgi:hypothetical protein